MKRLIGPDPRVIDTVLWAKLLWAAMNLTDDDLPRATNHPPVYPLEMVGALAVVWCFGGLRSDEIRRLRVGCIRRQREDIVVPETGEAVPKDAVCLLDVPVNKTSSAFTKPVHPIVGERIAAWERERPAQQAAVDHKTGEMVHYLFAVRGGQISRAYINGTLIPLLCRKAGVPERDERGPITSHRARSTIATQLYNAKVPMTLFQLQEWLGHRSPLSTQHYARVTPAKLAKAYVDTTYFEQNVATIDVLFDLDAFASEARDAALFFDLGHGLCANPYWSTCPHRLACAKCDYYVPDDRAQLLRARASVRRMRETVPVTEEEARVLAGDEGALSVMLERNSTVPPPAASTFPGRNLIALPVVGSSQKFVDTTQEEKRSAELE